MMERKARKSAVLVAAFALVGMIGIFAVSQAYGDDNTNVQAANANAYSAVPSTFSFDFFGEMENVASGISNGNVEVDNTAVQNIADNTTTEIEHKVEQAINEYEQANPGVNITNEGRKRLAQLFRDEEIKSYNKSSNNTSVSNAGSTNYSSYSGYTQSVVQQMVASDPTVVTTQEAAPTVAAPTAVSTPVVTSEPEPVIQNIETPAAPENPQPAPEQQVQQPVVPPVEINTNEPRVSEPLISKAIEDNVAAAATVTSTEPVIVEKQPTRGASLFGEDGLIAQIVSNPVLRAGIAAFPILIIILIAGFMISRRNEE